MKWTRCFLCQVNKTIINYNGGVGRCKMGGGQLGEAGLHPQSVPSARSVNSGIWGAAPTSQRGLGSRAPEIC